MTNSRLTLRIKLGRIKSDHKKRRPSLGLILVLLFLFISSNAEADVQGGAAILNEYIRPLLQSFAKKGVDFQDFLSEQKNIEIPKDLDIDDDFKKLPFPPNQDVREGIQEQSDSLGLPSFRLVWIEDKGIGGLYYTVGSGECQNWIMVQSDGQNLLAADPPDIFEPYVCGNDGGGFGHETFIAEIDNQVVAIKDGVEPTDSGKLQFHVELQVWDGSGWGQVQSTAISVNSRY